MCVITFYSFFFNGTPTTGISTLSLHDALPISFSRSAMATAISGASARGISSGDISTRASRSWSRTRNWRSEEHTSELQSRRDLVCRLLLEKKKLFKRNYAVIYQNIFPYKASRQ